MIRVAVGICNPALVLDVTESIVTVVARIREIRGNAILRGAECASGTCQTVQVVITECAPSCENRICYVGNVSHVVVLIAQILLSSRGYAALGKKIYFCISWLIEIVDSG